MTLREIQNEQTIWSQRNFKERHPEWAILGVCEELAELSGIILQYLDDKEEEKSISLDSEKLLKTILRAHEAAGRLAHATLKREQGIRKSTIQYIGEENDAVGDTVLFLMEFCNQRGYDLQTIVEETWIKVRQRDWKKFPKNGVSE